MLPAIAAKVPESPSILIAFGDEYIRDHIGNMIAYSKMIKNECEKHGLSYFDTSEDFSGAIEAAAILAIEARAFPVGAYTRLRILVGLPTATLACLRSVPASDPLEIQRENQSE